MRLRRGCESAARLRRGCSEAAARLQQGFVVSELVTRGGFSVTSFVVSESVTRAGNRDATCVPKNTVFNIISVFTANYPEVFFLFLGIILFNVSHQF